MNEKESKNWFISTSELEGQEIITRGRRHLKYVMDSGKYDERVEIEWEYNPLPGGMPTEEDDKFMNKIAFEIDESEQAADNTGYLTATYTGRERFFMVFYTCDIDKFAMILHKVLENYEKLPIQIGRIKDPDWSDYKEMLKRNGMSE
ncbi:MAG: DUF695 domain-containing protein [Bacteroidales bacterium]|nr:DUF695 domain-containing protein [Bacteroidales bacterium]